MKALAQFFYRSFLAPLSLIIYLLFVVPFFAKPRRLFQERIQQKRRRPKTAPQESLWIHASSGEFEYAKHLIRTLKLKNPELFVVATYSSPSYSKPIQNFPGVDHAEPLPFDLPGPISEFIRFFKPKAFLIARTDLWPEILWQCQKHRLQTVLFGASFPRPLGFWARLWRKLMLNQLDLIYLTRDVDQNRLSDWHVHTASVVTGDPRYDQVEFRLKDHRNSTTEANGAPITLCAGSTWPEDETALWTAAGDYLKSDQLRLIIAPHEPTEDHIKSIKTQAEKLGLQTQLYSKSSGGFERGVLIVDRLGVLAQLYAKAQIGFVGGSFRGKTHSVMESLGAGLMTFVGPYHTNNREAVDFSSESILNEWNMVVVTPTAAEFKLKLNKIIENQDQISVIQEKILQRFRHELGATNRIIADLQSRRIL